MTDRAQTRYALAVALLVLALGACEQTLPASSPLLDVRPTRLQRGDTLIIDAARVLVHGSHWLRAGASKVVLDGTFTSAAGKVVAQRVELAGMAPASVVAPAYSERVLVGIDQLTEKKLGEGEFVGRLGVEQPGQPGQEDIAWVGTEEAPLHLKLFPPTMRSLSELLADRFSHAPMLAWLGLEAEAGDDGLQVTRVMPGPGSKPGCQDDAACAPDYVCRGGCVTRAAKAGLQVGDRIVSADGRPVRTPANLATALRAASTRQSFSLGIKHAGRETTANISLRGRPLAIPVSVVQGTVMLVFAVIALTICMVIAGMLTWVERRVAGKMQSRVGPNRVGPLGALQWVADGIKLLLKEDIIPDAVDKPLFKLAPYLVFMGLLGTFVVLPFSQLLIISDLNVGLIYLIAITGFVSIGLMMAGWSSNNKWSLLGGMRSAAQIMSYEIPTGLALMVPVITAGTLSTEGLVERQGGLPWQWHVFDNPLLFGCFFIYFISALAEGNRTPFDLPEAESELVAGYNIEYSGWRFAVFFLSEWANLFVVGAVATTVFLGGWQVPWFSLAEQAASFWLQLLGLCIFFAKAMTLVFVIIWIRWTLPRFRVDQMMRLCWKYFVPWTFAAVLFQAFWVWVMPPAGRSVAAVLTFFFCGLGLLALFISRLVHNWKQNPEEKWSWNPFP